MVKTPHRVAALYSDHPENWNARFEINNGKVSYCSLFGTSPALYYFEAIYHFVMIWEDLIHFDISGDDVMTRLMCIVFSKTSIVRFIRCCLLERILPRSIFINPFKLAAPNDPSMLCLNLANRCQKIVARDKQRKNLSMYQWHMEKLLMLSSKCNSKTESKSNNESKGTAEKQNIVSFDPDLLTRLIEEIQTQLLHKKQTRVEEIDEIGEILRQSGLISVQEYDVVAAVHPSWYRHFRNDIFPNRFAGGRLAYIEFCHVIEQCTSKYTNTKNIV